MTELVLKDVRLAFPDLFVAKPFKEGDKPKFGATFLIPKNSVLHKQINAEILKVLEAKWPGKGKTILESIKTNANKFCFQDGDLKDYDGYEGCMALSAKNFTKPTVIDRRRNRVEEADGVVYAGCYVNAIVEIFAYDNTGKGVSASLLGVQYYRKGDAFTGGRPVSEDAFDDLSDFDDEEANGESDLA